MQLPYYLEESLKKAVEKHIKTSADDEHDVWNTKRCLLDDIFKIVEDHLDKKDDSNV